MKQLTATSNHGRQGGMINTNPVVAALPGQGWRFIRQDDEGDIDVGGVAYFISPVLGFLVYADGSVVAVAPDPDYAEDGVRPVTEFENFSDLVPPS